MKERVEAAFVAHEESNTTSNNEESEVDLCRLRDTSSNVPNRLRDSSSNVPNNAKQNESEPEERNISIPSEESSNDTDENTGNSENSVKLKNAILRNCFASLHRRQQKEKEQEQLDYLNGFN